MDYKEIINSFISKRYEYLIECSTNILRYNTNLTPEDLVSELVIHLLENETKVKEYIEINKLEAFSVSWLNIQGRYATSTINRKYNNNAYEIDDYMIETLVGDDDRLIYESDYIKELSKQFTDLQIQKILLVESIIPKLTKTEQILFEAYFLENLSYDKIVKKYTFFREKDGKRVKYKSKKSIYNLMKDLRKKIIKLIEE